MNKKDLVVLKGSISVRFETELLKPHTYYRHIQIEDQHMVFGIVVDKNDFKNLFEFAHDRVMRHFRELGLLGSNDKPLSKTAFNKLADVHDYGNGRKTLFRIWFFRKTRECIYGFYPMQGTKKDQLNECYQYYLDLVNGNVDALDNGDVKFGNCGIPLSYHGLRTI